MNWRITYRKHDALGPVDFVRDHEARTQQQAMSLTVRDLMRAHPEDWHEYKFVSPVREIERVRA